MYCDACDHGWQIDDNGVCLASVAGCSEPCGCHCLELRRQRQRKAFIKRYDISNETLEELSKVGRFHQS